MTLLTPEPPQLEVPPLDEVDELGAGDVGDVTPAPVVADDTDQPSIRPGFTAAAALLATLAAGWLAGSLFRDPLLPELLAMAGGLLGVGVVWLASRGERRAALAYLVVPIAAIAGAIATTPVARGGTSNLPNLVREAIASGGLLHAPLAFDPGWRFLLVVTYAVVGAAAVGLALARNRANLAIVVPLPFIIGGALLQPPGREVVASSIAVGLVIGALALAQGATIAAGTELGSGFEARRLARGGVIVVLLVGAIIGLSQADFLFPSTKKDQIIPPRRPPVVPIAPDRELFQVKGLDPGPWRIGALDSFDGEYWLLPAFDPAAQTEVKDGRLPDAPTQEATARTTFVVRDLSGRNLPVPGGAARVTGTSATLIVDPATGVPALKERVQPGFEYTVSSEPPPSAQVLQQAPPDDPQFVQEYSAMPPVPAAVQRLLTKAPTGTFDRLAYLRAHLYKNVIARGSGQPVRITSDRVADMLAPDITATPYEIVAAEAMLARWAAIPARIGFGYYGGDITSSGSYSVRPRNGAAWLEVHFQGHGWVPLVGTPPRAEGSSSANPKNQRPDVKQSDKYGVAIFTLVRSPSYQHLFNVVRYWAAIALAVAAGLFLLYVVWPVLCKWRRSSRRHAWGARHGPRAAALAAYADLRDRCYDLHLGDPSDTPLEFVARFERDSEHQELAWLVTRLVWGDLRRDAQPEDAEEAEAMAASVGRRIAQEQPPVNVFLGRLARASLRAPWNDETPNVWPVVHVRRGLAGGRARVAAFPRRLSPRRWPVLRPTSPVTPVLVLLMALVTGCGGGDDVQIAFGEKRLAARSVPSLVPESSELAGLRFVREPKGERILNDKNSRSLVRSGRVWSMRDGSVLQGTVQEMVLRADDVEHPAKVIEQLLSSIGVPTTTSIGPFHVSVIKRPGDIVYVWLPPHHNAFVLYVFRREFDKPETTLRALLGHATGFILPAVPEPEAPTPTPSPDPTAPGTAVTP